MSSPSLVLYSVSCWIQLLLALNQGLQNLWSAFLEVLGLRLCIAACTVFLCEKNVDDSSSSSRDHVAKTQTTDQSYCQPRKARGLASHCLLRFLEIRIRSTLVLDFFGTLFCQLFRCRVVHACSVRVTIVCIIAGRSRCCSRSFWRISDGGDCRKLNEVSLQFQAFFTL